MKKAVIEFETYYTKHIVPQLYKHYISHLLQLCSLIPHIRHTGGPSVK